MNRSLFLPAILAPVLLMGCSSPDFGLNSGLNPLTIHQGNQATVTVRVKRESGMTAPITVTAKNLPPGVTAASVTVAENASQGTLTLTAAPTAAVQATYKGDLRRASSGKSEQTRQDTATKATLTLIGGKKTHEYSLEVIVKPASGSYDRTYGKSGIRSLFFGRPEQYDAVTRVALDPEGRLLLVGNVNEKITLERLTVSGTPDTSFGQDGLVSLPGTDQPTSVVFDIEGRILVVLASQQAQGGLNVFRLTSAGQVDATYGLKGKGTFPLPPETSAFAYVSRVLSDGKLLLAGSVARRDSEEDFFPPEQPFVIQMNADGTPDQSFGQEGRAQEAPLSNGDIRDLQVAEDGSLYAVGMTYRHDPVVHIDSAKEQFLVHYLEDGSTDRTFGQGGFVSYTLSRAAEGSMTSSREATAVAVRLLDDEKILVGSLVSTGVSGEPIQSHLLRYLPDGSPDSDFGVGGVRVLESGGQSLYLDTLIPAQNGWYLAVLESEPNVLDLKPAVMKIRSDGTLDTSFSFDGKAAVGRMPGFADLYALQGGQLLAVTATFLQEGVDPKPGEPNVEVTRLNP